MVLMVIVFALVEDWASSTSESNGVDPNSCQEIFSSRCTKCTSDESVCILYELPLSFAF